MINYPNLLYADAKGNVFDDPGFSMAVFDGKDIMKPHKDLLIPLPDYSQLFTVPNCNPIGWNKSKKKFDTANKMNAVSAFLTPGYIRLYHPAYSEKKDYTLPLWAYSAVGFLVDKYYAPAILIDDCNRWNPKNYDDRTLVPEINKFKKKYKTNRLIKHLSNCAVNYHCFAAKNLFLQRWEAPLPVSRGCNSQCLGCISKQEKGAFKASHDRISFKPSVKEIVEIAVPHLNTAQEAIVSFGQGCEGEPLTEYKLINDAIIEIRKNTTNGIIHLNTNGYCPEKVSMLIDAGLDSIRISLSSARERLYNAYYQPKDYNFKDVIDCIAMCSKRGIYTTINYLVFPGITDEADEWKSLKEIIVKTKPHVIHFKNLNIDPHFYLKKMKEAGGGRSKLIGIYRVIENIQKQFNRIKLGYFNKSKKEIEEHLKTYR